MTGFKSFRRAQTVLAGIELVHMIRKGQYQHLKLFHLSVRHYACNVLNPVRPCIKKNSDKDLTGP